MNNMVQKSVFEPTKEELENKGALRYVPFMGVIYVVHRAVQLGFYNGHPNWSNLGQGQPEVGEMKGAPKRYNNVTLKASDHQYGPLGGNLEMRQAVADHYNRLYRKNKMKYGPENVSCVAGGRLGLTRIFAALDYCNMGYIIPDYTAYEDDLSYHSPRINTVLCETYEKDDFQIPPSRFSKLVDDHELNSFLISNPCNPTGQVIAGDNLKKYVDIGRSKDCTLIMDEFYSHFVYNGINKGISSAEYVKDVNKDPVLILDGLTKCFRYPGWRLGWVVGPKNMIAQIDRASSALDGGPSQVVQRAAIDILKPERADQAMTALREVFGRKRALMVESLKRMGIKVVKGEGTFYIWGSVENLPYPLNDGFSFFEKALQRKVMIVPGIFFDVNPAPLGLDMKKRQHKRYKNWVRFSFGPDEKNMVMGLKRLESLVRDYKSGGSAKL